MITIKLFATLREKRDKISEIEWDSEISYGKILNKLSINKKDVAIFLINGIHSDFTSPINDGDEISLFPPIGGG